MEILVDTHCHLDLDAFDADRDEAIERARAAGVCQMIVIGFNPERWESGARLCREHAGLHLAVGLHPTEAERFNDDLETKLQCAATSFSAVAVGEIGLDYHWKADTAPLQKEVFAHQIALAKELDLPFVVHQRDAELDALDVLRASAPPHRGVMHCFTGDSDYLRQCLELGLHVGLGGAITFRKLKLLHEALRQAPLDRIVLETDAPFMAPSPHRGDRNEPAYVSLVAARLADLKKQSSEEIAAATTRNAADLFHLPVMADATSSQPEAGR
jgi:TatD DNase family protein